MADDKAENKEGELALEDGGKKKKMLIIIIAVVVLLGAGGGYFFFMMGDEPTPQAQIEGNDAVDSEASNSEISGEEQSNAEIGSALYVPMPRPFRFNVPGIARDRFVEIRVQLLIRGSDNEENAKMHIPLIESTLLGVFSQANADDLSISAGKESLRQQSLAAVQKVMTDIESNKTVEKILFTGFVMQ